MSYSHIQKDVNFRLLVYSRKVKFSSYIIIIHINTIKNGGSNCFLQFLTISLIRDSLSFNEFHDVQFVLYFRVVCLIVFHDSFSLFEIFLFVVLL